MNSHHLILQFITTLRESSDLIWDVFMNGSCFRLFELLKLIHPEAEAYWSDRDDHCITKIGGRYYDIGGRVHPDVIDSQGYTRIPPIAYEGYRLMKHSLKEKYTRTVPVYRYKFNEHEAMKAPSAETTREIMEANSFAGVSITTEKNPKNPLMDKSHDD